MRLDSPYGRVSNDRVLRHPTPSTRQPLFTPFPGGSQHRSSLPFRDPGAGYTNTPQNTLHACFVLLSLLFIGLRVFALRCYRVLTHTGNHAFSSRFSPNSTCLRLFRYFAPLPTHSDLCLSADRCTGIACIHTYTVHHSPTFSRLSPPKTHHAWYASHTEPTVTRLG